MRIAIAILTISLSAVPASAGTDQPNDAAQFTAYCSVDGNKDDCGSRIMANELIDLAYPSSGKCTYPNDQELIAERKILDWLSRNPQPPGTTTDQAIQSAMNAMWPC